MKIEDTKFGISTDLVFWPNGRSIPSMPSGISVCFVWKSVVQQ